MKEKMFPKYILVAALAVALAGTALLAQSSQPKAGAQPQAAQSGMMSGGMACQCPQMMAMHNRMMADMKAQDAALDQKVAAMNAARGKAKVDAMAAVINQMVAQRKQMMSQMSGMQGQMMGQCPMMKGMAH